MTKGILMTIEGPDGAGKTTVLERVLPYLKEHLTCPVVMTREPGGIAISEKIREIILDSSHTHMDAKTELLLFIAARRQHFIEKVLPALKRGELVLIDRFIDSSLAYQGYGRGLNKDEISWLNSYATDDMKPDLTLYFDVDTETGLARINQNNHREVNRLDLEKVDMHQRVRAGYQELAKKEPNRIITIDAGRELSQVVNDVAILIKDFVEKGDYVG